MEFVQRTVLDRLEGRGRLTTEEESFPFVPDPLSEAEWSAMQQRLGDGAIALNEAIGTFPAERLDEPLVKGGSSAANNLWGLAQHNVYHSGQIKLMRNLLQSR